MPAAMAVQLPPLPAPTPPEPSRSDPPRKVSRLAPRPEPAPAGAPAAPPRGTPAQTLDVFHPAIAAHRPPPDVRPNEAHEQTMVKRARKTMYFAVTVLAIILIVAVVLVLGSE